MQANSLSNVTLYGYLNHISKFDGYLDRAENRRLLINRRYEKRLFDRSRYIVKFSDKVQIHSYQSPPISELDNRHKPISYIGEENVPFSNGQALYNK